MILIANAVFDAHLTAALESRWDRHVSVVHRVLFEHLSLCQD